MKIKIISVGKIKEKNIQQQIDYYSKQIPRIEFFEIKDLGKEDEGKKILELISKIKDNYVFVLSEEGHQFDSVSFSKELQKIGLDHEIIFVIGGPEGISIDLKKSSDFILSLSNMTFTHEMAKLFLVEQIYRAQSIINGKKYHKE